MPAQRRPLTIPLVSRDATAARDGRLTNCYSEQGPTGPQVIKRTAVSVQSALGAGCAQGAITFNGDSLFIMNDTIYTNFTPYAAGVNWTISTTPTKPTASSAVGAARAGYFLSLNGVLYLIGAKDAADANFGIYKSIDNGATWTTALASASAPWAGTSVIPLNNAATILNGRMYFLIKTSANLIEVWSSADGVIWLRNTSDARGGATTNNILGLVTQNGQLIAFYGEALVGSVWTSLDGTTWTSATTSPAWTSGTGSGFTNVAGIWTLNSVLYLAGPSGGGGVSAAVYKSVNGGITWTLVTAAAGWAARTRSAAFSYNNKLWIMGGSNDSGSISKNDVYSSPDGLTWTLVTAAAGWSIRHSMAFSVHNNTMYVGPGADNGVIVSGLKFAALAGALSSAITPTSPCLPMQIALIPATGAVVTKAFIKSTKDAWVWDGTTATKVTDADYPATTVFGVAYLDGTIYVMDVSGVIYGSDILLPLAWNALNFISAISEADAGIAIARQLDNIIAFKETSTEVFYDAGNAVGSPLAKVPNALLEIGLSHGGSIAYSDNSMYFMAQHRQKGRTIMRFEGTTPKPASNPWVDRILYGDDLANIYSFVVRLAGHVFYALTLKTSAITLVQDENSGEWHTMTKLTAGTAVSVSTAAVQADGSILITMAAVHGASDGDPVLIAGATPSAVNGTFNLRYDTAVHSTSQFSFMPATAVSGSITGTITAVFYTSAQFPGVYYARGSNVDLVLDETTGQVYKFDPTIFSDNSGPIDVHIRTEREDFGTFHTKTYNSVALLGDSVASNALLRYCDDDYATFVKYRLVDLSKKRPKATQLGASARRAWEIRHTGNTAFRLSAAEPDIEGW